MSERWMVTPWSHVHREDAGCIIAPACRPVAVIDPEDAEQVARLLHIMRPGAMGGLFSLQAALREYADPTPPKPEEPRGLGAVVEDADGKRWVRHDESWCCQMTMVVWSDIEAVRVLSEGVS